MADVSIVASDVAAVPQNYTVPGAQEILLRAVGCMVNGSLAAGEFLPALQMVDPAGHVMWTAVNRSVPVAAGASALVSWFPGGGIDGASSSTGSGGSVSSVTSPGGSLAVGSPSGPAVTLDIANSGVTPGTYGDATHTSQVTVNSEGIVTSASQVGISGLAGSGLVKLFDSTLGSNQLSIDTGANAIPAGHFGLLIYIYVRTDRVAANDDVGFRFNNDSGANYDDQQFSGANTGTAIGFQVGATSFFAQNVASTGSANSFTAIRIDVYNYDNTVGFKSAIVHSADAQTTAAPSIFDTHAAEWRSTAAINQFAVFSQTGSHLITGSRMSIFGLQ